MKVIKRNGDLVEFENDKISKAIMKAMDETEIGVDFPLAMRISCRVYDRCFEEEIIPTVEEIQDMIEELLAENGRFDVAKRYILYRNERTALRNKTWDMTELQKDIYENKYRFENETFNEFIERVSGGNSEVGKAIRNKDFIFAGRILAGRGLNRNVTLSNCYVLPQPEDNLESIFDTAKESARTYSYGGGVGFDISKLRPNGSKVNNSALTTSGAVSFMELFSTTTGLIGQRGRRGALMISMDIDHQDILEFIHSKRDLDKVTNANISIRSNDKFFHNLDKLENQEIIREMATSNWQSGEPGMLYWDRVQRGHLLQYHPEYIMTSTNPCGEQPLPDYGNCLLGSINLSNFVLDEFTDKARIDWDRLIRAVEIGVVALNEVLDEGIPLHPLRQQRETARDFRQIGLGIMGLSDMFIKMGIKYGNEESIEISKLLGETIRNNAILKSISLAKKYGTYPKFDGEIVAKSDYFKSLPEELQEMILVYGMRNSHVLSIAPTGSISTMWGISGGIEPIFAKSYLRTTKSLATEGDVDYKVYTKIIEELMDKLNITNDKDLPNYVVTSHEINPIDRVKLQSEWQNVVDSAISSTINLNEDATIEDIEDIYIQGWIQGLKGITVFRNNSFRMGILNTEPEEIEEIEECST